jgi:hypothetical protein
MNKNFNAVVTSEFFDVRRVSVQGKRFMTAVEREAYHADRLVAWKGRRTSAEIVRQKSAETRDEFYDRVAMQFAH